MRYHGFAIIGLLLIVTASSAQPAASDVNAVLRDWEKAMADVQSFSCVVQRKTADALGKEEHHGFALFSKTDPKNGPPRTKLGLTKVTNQEVFERYICANGNLYEYVPATQVVRIHKLQAANQRDSFLAFLFGMDAKQAKARYTISPNEKSNEHYHILWFEPKLAKDKGEFTKARLCLYKSNNMPAQITYVQGNGGIIEWSFTEMSLNQQIEAKHFQPELPKGWKFELAPALPMKAP